MRTTKEKLKNFLNGVVLLKGGESKEELARLKSIWNNAMAAAPGCTGPGWNGSRPGNRIFFHAGRKWEAAFHHDGGPAGIKEVEKE
jgi:hypothetical protein